jgi:hypothetical protein
VFSLEVKVQYNTDTDRQNVLDANKDKFLIEEQNITEGNFLIFTDEKPITQEITDLKAQLQTSQEAIDFLLMGGM